MEYLAEVTVYDPALPGERTLYFTSGTAFTTRPTETPANMHVDGRIRQPALIRRDLFDAGTTGGASRVGFGELVLANEDGALDAFATYAVDGRTLTIRTAASSDAAYPSGWDTLFTITMQQADRALDAIVIRIRDRQAFTEQPLQGTRYAGDNALPAGLEGIDSDLKGKPKPRAYGWMRNVTPVLVNTSRLAYQVHDDAVRDVMAVYDSGVLLGRGADYADEAALMATAPNPGTFRLCKALGVFRIGSAAQGQITCDVVEGTNAEDRTAAAIFRRVLTDVGYAGTIDDDALDALNAVQRSQVGLYYAEDVTVQQVLDDLARTVGAWWGQSRTGALGMTRLEAPAGTPAFVLTSANVLDFVRVPINGADGLPVRKVTVRGARNYTVQTNGLAGLVGSARRARLAQPYQDASDTDAAVLTKHPLAPTVSVETGLACVLDAQTEATRLLALLGDRNRYEVTVQLDATILAALDLGAVCSLTLDRYGLDAGVLLRVIGYQLNPAAGTAALTLWG